MTDRPIIFSAPMVCALLEGRKTQTRRLFKPQPVMRGSDDCCINDHSGPVDYLMRSIAPRFWCRFAVGDRLWVRERIGFQNDSGISWASYAADGAWIKNGIVRVDPARFGDRPRASIHMPRWASRLTLTVTDVRVQRLWEISEEDARAEGVVLSELNWPTYGSNFVELWENLHGPNSWSANPWVVALTFTVDQRNIDALREAA